jgi:hypothetical protein
VQYRPPEPPGWARAPGSPPGQPYPPGHRWPAQMQPGPPKKGPSVGWIVAAVLSAASLLVVMFVVGIGLTVRWVMLESTSYKMAFAYLGGHPEVVALVGRPVKAGFMPLGSVRTADGEGIAEYTFTVTGPRGAGEGKVMLEMEEGEWAIVGARFTPEGGNPRELQPRDALPLVLPRSGMIIHEGAPHAGASARLRPALGLGWRAREDSNHRLPVP